MSVHERANGTVFVRYRENGRFDNRKFPHPERRKFPHLVASLRPARANLSRVVLSQ